MKNLNLVPTVIISMLLIFMSCASESNYNTETSKVEFNIKEEQSNDNSANNSKGPLDRKIIKEGDIRFETNDAGKTRALIIKVLNKNGGYISKDRAFDYNGSIEHTVEVRVPAENFDTLLEQISRSADKLDSKNISSRDVTEEYVDIEARIKMKKELEARYSALLSKATNVGEILQIEGEIGALREELESIQGRYRFLNDRISMSTLTIIFYEEARSEFGFSSKISDAVQGGYRSLLWFPIGLTHIWPFVLIIGGGVYYVIRRKRSRNVK